jgi:hypothetical protein
MLFAIAVAALGIVGQPSLASDRATAPGCATMASHVGSSVHIGTGEMEGVASRVHVSHLLTCATFGCIPIGLGECNSPTPLMSVETAVIVRLGRAEYSGLAVPPGYRPPIAV